MVYNIDEREMSMEYLLQDLESECPGLTLRENTTQHSFDVVETTTDTLDVSSDTAADLPEHTFVKKVICGKSGKTKGQNQFSSTLH